MSGITYDNYLAHYGTKGVKRGVRREPGPVGTDSSRVKRPEGASVSVGAVEAYGTYQNPTVQKTVRNTADSTIRTVKNSRVRNSAKNYLKDNGFV